MRKPCLIAATLALALLAGCGKPAQHLVVYTAAEADQIPAYEASFRKAHPGIDIVWVRDSTGVVTAKLLAEHKAEQADVVFALAATSMMQLDSQGLLAPYKPAGEARLERRFRWPRRAALDRRSLVERRSLHQHQRSEGAQSADAHQLGRPDPAGLSRHDLDADPGVIGHGVCWRSVPGCRSWAKPKAGPSWTGCTRTSPAMPIPVPSRARDAARGEIPIGISVDFRAAQAKAEGLPIDIVIPKEGLGWDLEATGLVAGSRQPEAAKAFVDWAMSPAAMQLYAQNFALVADPLVSTTASKLPADLKDRLAAVDLAWTAKNRQRIIDEWSRRYGVKAEPIK